MMPHIQPPHVAVEQRGHASKKSLIHIYLHLFTGRIIGISLVSAKTKPTPLI